MHQEIQEGTLLWEPSDSFKDQTNLAAYMDWLKNEKQLEFADFDTLWNWSVTELEDFWDSMWEDFDIQHASSYNTVLSNRKMPCAKWFEVSMINFTENIIRHMTSERPAILFESEIRPLEHTSWNTLYRQVTAFAAALKESGVQKGDRVTAYIPNIPEAVVAFLATASIGAIWSSCSPDFGSAMVIDRFKQIEPTILIAADGYRYNGKDFDRMDTVKQIEEHIPTLKKTIVLPYLNENPSISILNHGIFWNDFTSGHEDASLMYHHVAFDHPLWVLFSSGTTGLPKPIVQGQGGILMEHLKACTFHMDLKPEDRFFWFTTTGWMMWNLLVGVLLSGATIVLYDGSPGYPDMN